MMPQTEDRISERLEWIRDCARKRLKQAGDARYSDRQWILSGALCSIATWAEEALEIEEEPLKDNADEEMCEVPIPCTAFTRIAPHGKVMLRLEGHAMTVSMTRAQRAHLAETLRAIDRPREET